MSVDSIANKIDQATAIKLAIRAAAESKGAVFPADCQFEDYPEVIGAMKGLLQATKTVTPTAEGVTAGPDEGYDGMESVTILPEPNLIPDNISAGTSIFGVVGVAETFSFNAQELFGGTLETFIYNTLTALRQYAFYNYPSLKRADMAALTALGQYAFYGCTGLQQVDISVLEEVGQYAFNNCTALTTVTANALKRIMQYGFYNCTNLAALDLSKLDSVGNYGLQNCKKIAGIGTLTVPVIGDYGCDYLGNTSGEGFVYQPKSAATLGNYALRYARLTNVKGEINSIGQYGISYCPALTDFEAVINGPVGNYGLAYNYYMHDIDLSESVITNLGTYAFYQMGYNRTNYATDRLMLDLRKSTFKTADQYAFAGNGSSNGLRYADIFLPETITTVNSYAFRYLNNTNVYFSSTEPPKLSATNCFNNCTNHKILVPFDNFKAYAAATNWVSLVSYMMGYAPAGRFAAGEALPASNGEGYALTWYSDIAKTNVITTAPDSTSILYCEIGSRVEYIVWWDVDANTTLTLTDTEGVSYTVFPAHIPAGRGINLALTEQEGWSNYTSVNGTEVELPYSIAELTTDLTIASQSWEGDIDPDFANCAWANIKKAVEAGVAATFWPVGTTRSVTLKNGKTYTLRIANNSGNLYQYADGPGHTGFIMEFVELWHETKYMHGSGTNVGGWNASYMRNTVMPLIWAELPDDMASVIATVKTKSCYSGNDGTLVESSDTLFLPAEREIFATRSYSRQEEWDALQRWQYYAQNDTANARIKKLNGSAQWWWERSPYSGSSYYYCSVNNSGGAGDYYASSSSGVAPGFCI